MRTGLGNGFQPLPARPRPFTDEVLSCWLARLSRANAIRPHQLLTIAVGTRHNYLEQDLDCFVPLRVVKGLSKLACIEPEALRALSLEDWVSRLTTYSLHRRMRRWILPQLSRNRTPMHPWIQFCSRCLAEDHVPYFRRFWRLAFVTLCPRHNVRLRDRCPHCDKPIGYLSPHFDPRPHDQIPPVTVCLHCTCDVRKADPPEIAKRRLRTFERSIHRSVERGFGPTRRGLVFVQLILDVLFILLSQVRRLDGLRRLVPGVDPSTPHFTHLRRRVPPEQWSIERRHEAMIWLSDLLYDWPDMFVERCRSARVWSYALWGDHDFVPFWFASIVSDHLARPWHSPSAIEEEAVQKLIRRYGEPDTAENRRRWLGRYFQRRPHMLRLAGELPRQLDLFLDSNSPSQSSS